MSIALAKRYADALGEVIAQPGSDVDADGAIAQLDSFGDLIDSSRDLRNVFASPAVALDAKRTLIRKLAGQLGLSAYLRNFLLVLADNRRLDVLDAIRVAMRENRDEAQHLARVEIASAKAIAGDQKQQLVGRFAELLGREVRAAFVEDDSLLGGVLVRHGSTVYDGSVRAQLARLERRIAGEV